MRCNPCTDCAIKHDRALAKIDRIRAELALERANWSTKLDLMAEVDRLRTELAEEMEAHEGTRQAFSSATREAVRAQKAIVQARELCVPDELDAWSEGELALAVLILRALDEIRGA